MGKSSSLSIFFPCYNDSKTIGRLVENAFVIAKSLTDNFEVIVIDDGSIDSSRKILENLAKKYKQLKLVFHTKNLGYGGTLKNGFKESSKDLIFYTDGDGQYDVRELPLLFQLMSKDVDFINGIKMTRHDFTYRVIMGNLYNFIARWLFLLPTYDVDCDFRLIRKTLIKRLDLKSNSGSICVELVKKAQRAKASFRQVSIHHFERKYGNSQFFIPRHLIATFIELIFLWTDLMVIEKIKKYAN